MASQPLEALLKIVTGSQNAARSRNVEPAPPRAGDDADRFGPVLDRALNTDDGAATRQRRSALEGDAEPADNSADDDEATSEAPAQGERASTAPETDDDDAAEISAEAADAAAAVAAQAATIAVAEDEASALDAAAKTAAAEAAADQESGEDVPQSHDKSAARATAAAGESELKLGAAARATDAKEIGDVLPTPAEGAKELEGKLAVERPIVDGGEAEAAAKLPDLAAGEADDEGSAPQPSAPPTGSTAVDEAKLASPQADPESGGGVDPMATTDGTDDAPSENGGERDARATTPQRAIETPPNATIDAGAPTADGGAALVPSEAPADQNAAQPVTAGGAADSTVAARDAAALARLSAARTGAATDARGDGDGIGQVDRGRFLGRVEGAIRTAQQRDGRVQVRLSPPELGSLRIELTVQNGVMTARLEAETSAARNLLLDNLPALRDRLAQQDIRVERFDVDVRRDGGGGSNQHEAQDRPTGDPSWRQGDQRRERAAARPAENLRGPRTASSRTTTDAELDVRV